MEKILRHILLGASFVLVFGACEDQLTRAPLDAPSDLTFFENREHLDIAINGVYNSLYWMIRDLPALQEIDNSTDIGFLRSGPTHPFSVGTQTPTNAVVETTWERLYRGIGKANNLLENMPRALENVDEDYYKNVQAQAMFLRAFFYHYLAELYGDVPLITVTPSLEEAQIGRSPKNEVVEQIISDLEFASENLPITWSSSDEGRVTKGAALSLLARVALYNGNFELAALAANEVMNLGVYSLHPNYEEQFQYAGIRSDEVILDIPFSPGVQRSDYPIRAGERMTGSFSTNIPSQALVDSYQSIDGLHIDESPLYDPANPFENRDPRLYASIVTPQSTILGFVFETHPDSSETWDLVNNRRVGNQNVTNAFASFTGYIWRKYVAEEDFPNRGQGTWSELNWIYIRYAEVLLTYAEAKIELGDIDASVIEAMNKVRARGYGVESSDTDQYPAFSNNLNQAELRRELRYERKIELVNEGFRLFDIRRWGIADKVMTGTLIGRPLGAYESIPAPPQIDKDNGHHPDYSAYQNLYRSVEQRSFNPNRDWLWPMPQTEINTNANITQNPGY